MNRGTIIDVPWWYKTWQHSGYNHTCVIQNLQQRPQNNVMKFRGPTRKTALRGPASSECLFWGSAKLHHFRDGPWVPCGEGHAMLRRHKSTGRVHFEMFNRSASSCPSGSWPRIESSTRNSRGPVFPDGVRIRRCGQALRLLSGAALSLSVVEEDDDVLLCGCFSRSTGSGFSTQCYAWFHSDTCAYVSLLWFWKYFKIFYMKFVSAPYSDAMLARLDS